MRRVSDGPLQQIQLPILPAAPPAGDQPQAGDIALLRKVDVQVTVELGSTTRTIGEILAIGTGTVIELDKVAGEPVEILVNRTPIARGEVVVIDDSYGVRVTEIISRAAGDGGRC